MHDLFIELKRKQGSFELHPTDQTCVRVRNYLFRGRSVPTNEQMDRGRMLHETDISLVHILQKPA